MWYHVNYQQNDWTEWLSVAEFQCNNKKYAATEYTPFKLNFGRYLWKENLVMKMKLSKLEFSSRTLRKLGSGKKVDRDSKRSYEETIWQEKKKSTRIRDWQWYIAWVQKYPFKLTLKEAGPEKIWTF